MQCLCLLLLLLMTIAHGAENREADTKDWGRLFTTPAERARLDAWRAAGESLPTAASMARTGQEAPPEPSISVQGYIKPGDGGNGTVWVNGMPLKEHDAEHGVAVQGVRADYRIRLRLNDGRLVDLKAGQAYRPAASLVDSLERADALAKTGQVDSGQAKAGAGW